MKPSFVMILLLFTTLSIAAQNTAPGYIQTNNDDSIAVQIKVNKGVFGQIKNNFYKEVDVIYENGELKKFKPGDIQSFGFTMDNVQYQYFSKPTASGDLKFLVPMVIGPTTSLYYYSISTEGKGTTMGSNNVYYTFEKSDGTFISLRNILNKKFRSEVKTFYKDYEEAQILIDEKLKYWLELNQDLIAILNAVNKS